MANVTKINLDGTAYDIADNSARSTASAAQSKADSASSNATLAKNSASNAMDKATEAQESANAIAAKAVTVKYNSTDTSIVVTTGIPLS